MISFVPVAGFEPLSLLTATGENCVCPRLRRGTGPGYGHGLGAGGISVDIPLRSLSQGSKDSSIKGKGPGEAETDISAADFGLVAATNRRLAAMSTAAPAAASDHAVSAVSAVRATCLYYPWAPIFRGTVIIIVPGIFHPLPYIPVHIIQTEVIRLFLAY